MMMENVPQIATPTQNVGSAVHKAKPFDWLVLVLVLAFISAFNFVAMHDRLLLIIYLIAVAGAAFTLLRRGAFVFTVVTLTAASTALLINVYFHATADTWHPVLDGIRDLVALCVFAFGIAKLIHGAFRILKEARETETKRLFESQLVAMRAAALRSTSHEVRTPLSTILAINETLLNGSAGPLNEIQHDFLKDTESAARHLINLVNDILDYAKAESGMITLSPEPVALVELVDQCISMTELKATEAKVTISAHVDPDVNEIEADPLRLKQILINLLSNAIKYNEPSGLVNVRVRLDGHDILISVRDTGRGISEENMQHLFNPYFQAARTDQGIGTGLGLAIIKHLTELHGGTITVDSVTGSGSVFTVRLPQKAEIMTKEVDSPLMPSELENLRSGATSDADTPHGVPA